RIRPGGGGAPGGRGARPGVAGARDRRLEIRAGEGRGAKGKSVPRALGRASRGCQGARPQRRSDHPGRPRARGAPGRSGARGGGAMDETRVAEPRTVVVAGDVTIDWNLARIPLPPDPNMPGKRGTTMMSYQPGGAALLGEVITAVADAIQKDGGDPIDVRTVGHPERP